MSVIPIPRSRPVCSEALSHTIEEVVQIPSGACFTASSHESHDPISVLPHGILARFPCNGRPSIHTLPIDVLAEILRPLHPTDLICLGLTCKTLLATVLPHINSTPAEYVKSQGYHCNQCYAFYNPDFTTLPIRLTYGWIRDKKRWRYCPRCHEILPRKPEIYHVRLKGTKTLPYREDLCIPEIAWKHLPKKQRYKALVSSWCHSPSTLPSDLQKTRHSQFWCPKQHRPMLISSHRNSVSCPMCFENEVPDLENIKHFRNSGRHSSASALLFLALIGGCVVLLPFYLAGKAVEEASLRVWEGVDRRKKGMGREGKTMYASRRGVGGGGLRHRR
jgi:hypothetical protein